MAGTRLALSFVYAFEVFALAALAVFYAVSKSHSISTKWYPSNQPFIPVRSGMKLLTDYNFSGELEELRQQIDKLSMQVNLGVLFIDEHDGKHQDSARTLSVSLREGILTSLQEEAEMSSKSISTEDSISEKLVKIFPFFRINTDINFVPNDDLCQEKNIEKLLQKQVVDRLDDSDLTAQQPNHSYNIYITKMDCNIFEKRSEDERTIDATTLNPVLDIHENGSMMLRLPQHLSDIDVYNIVRQEVWPEIWHLIYGNNPVPSTVSGIPSPVASSLYPSGMPTQINLSIVDANPSSRVGSRHGISSEKNHHRHLNTLIMEAMDKSLAPMVRTKLSQVTASTKKTDISLIIQSLPYYGMDLSTSSYHSHYEDGSEDYTLTLRVANRLLLQGELADVAQGFVSPILSKGRTNEDDITSSTTSSQEDWESFNKIQLFLYVPDAESTPLYVTTGGDNINGWSNAFSVPNKHAAMSILNIPRPLSFKSDLLTTADIKSETAITLNSTGNIDDSNGDIELAESLRIEEREDQGLYTMPVDFEEESDEARDDRYKDEIRKSLSKLGSFLRREFGFERKENTSSSQRDIRYNVYINHLRADFGIAQWEIDRLLRRNIKLNVKSSVILLERVYQLVHLRKGLSFSLTSAERMIECADLIKKALEVIENTRSDNQIDETSSQTNLQKVSSLLNEALYLSHDISTDEDIFEVPFFALDQLFAVFGSLLLPLAIPMLKNLQMETKRYRQKSGSKSKNQSK
mmetsp:Transcript_21971/g.33399  ORF Transcript_21971/g.33399 Transcript_21971/m.33399 type:complete len:747 (-) Transcript_21971:22-2262(-)